MHGTAVPPCSVLLYLLLVGSCVAPSQAKAHRSKIKIKSALLHQQEQALEDKQRQLDTAERLVSHRCPRVPSSCRPCVLQAMSNGHERDDARKE